MLLFKKNIPTCSKLSLFHQRLSFHDFVWGGQAGDIPKRFRDDEKKALVRWRRGLTAHCLIITLHGRAIAGAHATKRDADSVQSVTSLN